MVHLAKQQLLSLLDQALEVLEADLSLEDLVQLVLVVPICMMVRLVVHLVNRPLEVVVVLVVLDKLNNRRLTRPDETLVTLIQLMLVVQLVVDWVDSVLARLVQQAREGI